MTELIGPVHIFEDIVLFGPYLHGQPTQRLWCPEDLRGNRVIENEEEAATLYDELMGDVDSFREDALNAYNDWFYHHKYSPNLEVLHNTFTENEVMVAAIGNCITEHKEYEMRVKIIMAGSSSAGMMSVIALQHPGIHFCTELSDFFDISLHQEMVSNLRISVKNENILEGLELISSENRFDVMISTYGFDSVWMKGDAHYGCVEGDWYRSVYRLHKVEETSGDGKSPYVIETICLPIEDILTEQYGHFISKAYGGKRDVAFNFPSGLITCVQKAFENQLHDEGVFVVGDIAHDYISETVIARGYEFLESGAMYKIEEYGLAVAVLQDLGFNAQLYSAKEFMSTYTVTESDEKLFGKYVIVVRRDTAR